MATENYEKRVCEMKNQTIYITVRVDFEHDGRFDEEDVKDYTSNIIVGSINTHSVENGIKINNVENCGENIF